MTCKIGSKGEAVKQIQRLLGCMVDGVFGKNTDALVKAWQKKHNLVADGIVGPATWNAMFGDRLQGVEYNPIDVHITKRRRSVADIRYLVIHYTAGASSKKGSTLATRNVWLRAASSADFIVDDVTMMQVNPDPLNWYTWAVGDGGGKYGITNTNSISIEICCNLAKGTTAKVPNHEGWTFTKESLDNAVRLAKMLMEKYDIPLAHVVRHYDASHKLCPGIIGWNPGILYDKTTGKATGKKNNESAWIGFKNRLK